MERIITSNDIAELVRQRRRELGLSQAQLAAQVGVSRQWIIDIEKGKPRAELALTLALLQVLGVQLEASFSCASSTKTHSVDSTAGEAKIQELAQAFDFLDG